MGNHSVLIREGDKGGRLHVLEFLLHAKACQSKNDETVPHIQHSFRQHIRSARFKGAWNEA
jgi:hypothetical protein